MLTVYHALLITFIYEIQLVGPGTSFNKPTTSSGGPSQSVRPTTQSGRPLSGFLRPGTQGGRPGTMEQAIRTPRTAHTAR